jgi:hypothetical protein
LFLLGLGPLVRIPSVELAPFSLITVIPGFLVGSLGGRSFFIIGSAMGALVAPTAFIVVALYVRKSDRHLPWGSVAAFAILAILSWAFAVVGWDSTVRYASLQRAVALVIQSAVPPFLLLVALLAMRKKMTAGRSILLHWAALAWFSWSAFPWYGELL